MFSDRESTRVVFSSDAISRYTHPMKEDVKKKDFFAPLGEMRVW